MTEANATIDIGPRLTYAEGVPASAGDAMVEAAGLMAASDRIAAIKLTRIALGTGLVETKYMLREWLADAAYWTFADWLAHTRTEGGAFRLVVLRRWGGVPLLAMDGTWRAERSRDFSGATPVDAALAAMVEDDHMSARIVDGGEPRMRPGDAVAVVRVGETPRIHVLDRRGGWFAIPERSPSVACIAAALAA